jgi:predicted lipid-binding transport protein (Tim44 family)
MQDSFDLTTIIFLGLAIFVIWRLRSVLGTRTGHERPPAERSSPACPDARVAAPADGNVVRLPDRPAEGATSTAPLDDPERWKGITEVGSPLATGLDAIVKAEPDFNPREFVAGARSAYEMIVTAFASGERRALKDLLSKEVHDGFVGAIAEREKRGETVDTTFVSIDKAELVDAQLKGRVAQLTVRFVSKLITATRDRAGAVIDGSPEKVVDVTDVWTFSRDAGSRDPNWRLIATESGQ